ncbi:hypothetical protein NC653_006308 [Populus alba x Populus x berolinensis]|uniref:Uncharacterized protein n=1 Tax=Populus alba x Populus x berolinensis TaxID=444605 RepID=A0AAD6RDZ9_9ROSI|nr:hypothetical protein NC653_006308 [Populus alba x Populus x berolinensis]
MIRCDAKFLPSRDARSGKQERVKSILLAQKEAFGECIDLELVGNVKGAQASTRQQGNKDSGISTNEETSGLVDDAPDEEDDGQRKRKRVQSKEGVDQAGLYQAHPLKIILHIFDDEDRLKDQKITSCATCFPVTLALSCLTRYGRLFSLAFDERRTSRPYKWAQHLAGIGLSLETAPLLSDLEPASSETAINEIVLSGLSLNQYISIWTEDQRVLGKMGSLIAAASAIIVADSGCPALFKEHLHMVHLPYELLGYLNANLLGKSTATNSLLIVLIVLFVSNVVLVSLLKDYKFMFPVGVLQVNLYILKLLPLDQENHVLAHQVHCLAVLFEYFIDEASPSAKCSSAVDVGLCKPVSGNLLARSFRGRDRRKMISWKGMACTSGDPY